MHVMGTRIGEPITKHLYGEIWELRPLENRILYAYYENDTFILLHHFKKKTKRRKNQAESGKKIAGAAWDCTCIIEKR